MSDRINVMSPWLGEEEAEAVAEVDRARLGRPGPAGRRASSRRSPTRCRRRSRSRPRAAPPRCTWRSIVAGVGPGDDVVVPSFSFIATANAVRYVGARPVFADVDLITGNLTARDGRGRADSGARGPSSLVDQGGVPVDLDAIRAASATRCGIVVVEDAACGAGSTYRGARSARAPRSPPGRSTRASSSPPARAGCSRPPRATGRRARGSLREHAMSVSAADRHASAARPPRSTSRSASTSG